MRGVSHGLAGSRHRRCVARAHGTAVHPVLPLAEGERADLTDASFAGSDLRKSDFKGAILKNTDFTGAKLTGAKFDKKPFNGAKFDKKR